MNFRHLNLKLNDFELRTAIWPTQQNPNDMKIVTIFNLFSIKIIANTFSIANDWKCLYSHTHHAECLSTKIFAESLFLPWWRCDDGLCCEKWYFNALLLLLLYFIIRSRLLPADRYYEIYDWSAYTNIVKATWEKLALHKPHRFDSKRWFLCDLWKLKNLINLLISEFNKLAYFYSSRFANQKTNERCFALSKVKVKRNEKIMINDTSLYQKLFHRAHQKRALIANYQHLGVMCVGVV